MKNYILAFDQGTTSSRSIIFDSDGRVIAQSQKEFPQILPAPGHVEHNPNEIWSSQIETAHEVIKKANIQASEIAAIGITNQRETTVLWDKQSGEPIGNAIVWQSRISQGICEELKSDGLEALYREKTGLVLDPYFSGTKVRYLLDQDPELRSRAERGEIAFGTVDSFLIWKLTNGAAHITDVSNASRTLMFNIHTLTWDEELCQHLHVPMAMLPQITPSSGLLTETAKEIFGEVIPITGCAGDQQAATFGQTCFSVGSAKNTYGTGCFLMMNIGEKPIASKSNLLTTVGWQIGDKTTYCLEGSVFVAGAAVQWLRDGLGLIQTSEEVERLASEVPDSDGVMMVPAFVGLGAPYWDPYARGMIIGITRGTTAAHIAKATIESMAYQTYDLIEAMQIDATQKMKELRVDGGACVNNPLMQFQADLLNVEIHRPSISETTALGAAYLAGLGVGIFPDLDALSARWQLDQKFTPQMDSKERNKRVKRWKKAVERTRDWEKD